MHAVCSNVCRRRSHGENTHGSRPTPTKNQQGAAMRRDWEKRCSASSEEESQVRVLVGIFRKEASEVREEQQKHEKVIETNHDEEASIRSATKDDRKRKGEPRAPPNR